MSRTADLRLVLDAAQGTNGRSGEAVLRREPTR